MTSIHLETRIAAPAMRVFLLSLSIDLHAETASQTRERAIAGITQGIIRAGESVTWRGRHFGLELEHRSLISRYEPPLFFEDAMTQGMFSTFVHRHNFRMHESGTLMKDELIFSAPFGVLGTVVERVVLKKYLEGFLVARNEQIRRVAENDEWLRFIPSAERHLCL